MSFTTQLLQVNSVLLIPLLCAVFAAFGAGGLFFVRRFIPIDVARRNNEIAGYVFATVGTVYAVLLAFIVLISWEDFNLTKRNAAQEESAALTLLRNMKAYPDRDAIEPARRTFLQYIESVMREEYPALRRMREEPRTMALFQSAYLGVTALVPRTPREQILYREMLEDLRILSRYRALRILSMQNEIAAPLWAAILLGAVLTIGFTFLFGTEHIRAHLLVTSILAFSIALVVYVILELDHPFTGSVRLDPGGYGYLLDVARL